MSSTAEFGSARRSSRSGWRALWAVPGQLVAALSTVQTLAVRVLMPRPIKPVGGPIRKILIVKLDELGDAMMAWPLINDLREGQPEAEITLLVNQSVAGMWEGVPGLRVLKVDVRAHQLLRPFLLPIRHYRFVAKHLHDQRFDLCLIPRRDADDVYATFLAYFTGSRRRVSFSEKSTPRKAILNRTFDRLLTDALPPPAVQHESASNRVLLTQSGLAANFPTPRYPLPKLAIEYAERALPENASRYVAICPTSGHSKLKQWGVERFTQVAEGLVAAGTMVVLVGGPRDVKLGHAIEAVCRGRCVNFIGNTSLPQMAALLSRCGTFVGNDAGPMHVASALGIHTVGIFGSSCSHMFGPWGPRPMVLAGMIDCSPCHYHPQNRCDYCVHDRTLCFDRVPVAEVLRAILSGWERGGPAALLTLP